MKSVFLPRDQRGQPVHAHGGQILRAEGRYYWIGEDRTGRNKVSCYASDDLVNWELRGHPLTLDSAVRAHRFPTDPHLDIPGQRPDIGAGCNIERPRSCITGKPANLVVGEVDHNNSLSALFFGAVFFAHPLAGF